MIEKRNQKGLKCINDLLRKEKELFRKFSEGDVHYFFESIIKVSEEGNSEDIQSALDELNSIMLDQYADLLKGKQ